MGHAGETTRAKGPEARVCTEYSSGRKAQCGGCMSKGEGGSAPGEDIRGSGPPCGG